MLTLSINTNRKFPVFAIWRSDAIDYGKFVRGNRGAVQKHTLAFSFFWLAGLICMQLNKCEKKCKDSYAVAEHFLFITINYNFEAGVLDFDFETRMLLPLLVVVVGAAAADVLWKWPFS